MYQKHYSKRVIAIVLSLCLMLQMVSGISVWATEAPATLAVTDLQCDSTVNPLGIDNQTPSFSWKLNANQRSVMQESYRIVASTSQDKLAKGEYDVYDTGVVASDASVGIVYDGPALTSATRYFWKVIVTDNKGNSAQSSEESYWEMGLLNASDWDAKWIQLDTANKPNPSKYTIDLDFRIIKDDIGIIFAAKDGSNYLMWQINTFEKKFGGKTSFRPHQWVNGGATCVDEFLIDDAIPVDKQNDQHHMQIAVDGKTITTFINGNQIDQRTNNNTAYGLLGFRQFYVPGDCDEQGAFDNIVVKDGDGNTLFSDDFSTNINTSFEVGVVENQELVVTNATGFQKPTSNAAPMYRKEFDVNKEIKKATIHSSSLGIYDLELNGKPVSDDFFNPGWTNYELNQDGQNYVMYQTFDVTDLMQQGENVLGAITGHGWYSGKLFVGGNNRYGTGSKLLCQLEVEYTNGDKEIIGTDSSWKITGNGPILADDFQNGETYDASREMDGWSKANFTEGSDWLPAAESSYSGAVVAQMGPTVKSIQEFKPLSVTEPTPKTYIFDLGQNISGLARMNVTGEAGTVVKLRFGEMLKPDGTLYTDNLRSAKATDYYTLKGDPDGETWNPRFTFHGFRYVEVTGYPGVPTAEDITGVALSSLQNQTGTFETSNADVNQLQSNIVWGQKDNFISVPTDCPQRDERLGYTGDGQVFARTAVMNMDTSQFFKKFMADVTTNQRADGGIADWTPNYVTPGDSWSGSFGNSGWGDAVVIIPWTMYTTYGDTAAITESYDAMKKWVDRYKTLSGDKLTLNSTAYGDWLSINADTPKDVISTGFFAYCADLLSKMATAIGENEDATYYRQLFLDVRTAFNREFVATDGRIKGDTQTSYLIALKFDLLPTQQAKEKATAYLVEDIEEKNWHLSTGFIGVAYLCPMLTEMGYADVAYKLLLQDGYPSWLYSVRSGATTIWERWNSYNAETGEFGDVGMNSFNHYSLGSVGEWFYNYVSGITYDENAPGYKHSIINPNPGGGLDYANGSFESVYGTIVSNWKYTNNDTFVLEATVPANTTATISVPTENVETLTESGVKAVEAEGLTFIEMKDGKAVFEAGSGRYIFTSESAREYLVNIDNEDPKVVGTVRINDGEPQQLPLSQNFSAGDEVTLEASALNDVDYKFVSWSGDVTSTNSKITFTVNGNMDINTAYTSHGYTNLARHKTVSASTAIENADWGKSRLTDGQLTSTSGSLGYTSNSSKTPNVNHWVDIDLGANTDLNRIQIYPRSDVRTANGTTPSFPKNFTLQIRKDGETNYTTIGTYEDYQAPTGKPAVFNFEEMQNARYVRLNVSVLGDAPAGEDYYLQLAEMSVLNLEAVPEPEPDLVALDRTTWTAQAFKEAGASDAVHLAFDGDWGTRWASGTTMQPGQWISFDMGSVQRFSQLVMETASEKDHPVGYHVYVSNDGKEWGDPIASGAGTPNTTTIDFAEQNAQYVKIEQTGANDKWWTINELNVFQIKQDQPSVDKAELQKAITAAAAFEGKQADYTVESWATFAKALATANSTVADDTATQEAVNTATTALNAAIAGLTPAIPPIPGDSNKTILKAVIEYANTAKASDEYKNAIDSVKTSFDAQLTAAQEVYNKADATQEQVNNAWMKLMNEIHKLGFQAGEKSQLTFVIEKAMELDLNDYVEAGQAEFKAMLKAAQDMLANGDAMQAEVDKAATDLVQAMFELRFKANKDILDKVLGEAIKLETSLYTAQSVKALQSAIDNGNAVMADPNANKEQIEQAAAMIEAARQGLVLIETPSTEKPVDKDDVTADGAAGKTDSATTGDTNAVVAMAALMLLAAGAVVFNRKKSK